jgi:putative flavoprotein involved in K+ transport
MSHGDPRSVDTVVIGGGQAGLATSWHLARAGVEHVVLEAGRVAESWRSRRWDSFTLVTPNSMTTLPGFAHRADEPGAFIPRNELVTALEGWARDFSAPVVEQTRVDAVAAAAGGFEVRTSAGPWRARRVVVATGYYRQPRWPSFSAAIRPSVTQLDAIAYRNPDALAPSGVLVVGSGQSGCQIAEELLLSGRDTWLAAGNAGRLPRRYRGRDGFDWLVDLGFFDLPEERFPDPRGRRTPNPHLSGARGGHSINLHVLARRGMRLLGHVTGVEGAGGGRLRLAPDLAESLRAADAYRARMTTAADALAERTGMDVTPATDADDEPTAVDGFAVDPPDVLDLGAAGITSVIWACGYAPDFSFLQVPALDAAGFPIHEAGLSRVPGLGFVGLRFQRTAKSDLLFGVGDDAHVVVDRLLRPTA